jgi:hypothetical protein
MKNLFLTVLLMLVFSGVSNYAQQEKNQPVSTTSGNDVEVYYFHYTGRCVTCLAIESETKKDIEMLYNDQFKSGKISFTALNLEEPIGKSIGDKLGVYGQTLLIVKGEQKIDITLMGFLYAVEKQNKFQEVLKEKIDPLMK